MKKAIIISMVILTVSFLSCTEKPTLEELKKFAAVESYPVDNFLDTVLNKKAMVIVAHDDDDCAMSGTLAKLKAEGWQIQQLNFVVHNKNESSISKVYSGNKSIVEDGIYRPGKDTIEFPYVPISREEMEKQFLREKITKGLLENINSFHPSVIFTLDNEMGGYGHPEHIYLSQLVVDLYKQKKSIPTVFINQCIPTTWKKKL
ncbi:MAG: PIG-L family deacetylase [Bacteroidetes bacterium]|nr:PIG-L family deacetylase [Bacteroidota bacterium]